MPSASPRIFVTAWKDLAASRARRAEAASRTVFALLAVTTACDVSAILLLQRLWPSWRGRDRPFCERAPACAILFLDDAGRLWAGEFILVMAASAARISG